MEQPIRRIHGWGIGMDHGVVKRVHVRGKGSREVVDALRQALGSSDLAGILVFVSPVYDLDEVACALRERFACAVAACTTAGEIGDSYAEGTLCAIAFDRKAFGFHLELIEDLGHPRTDELRRRLANPAFRARLTDDRRAGGGAFACLLVDGLSKREEHIAADVHHALDGIPLIGGSAGDALRFERTCVYTHGTGFVSNAAVLAIVFSKLPFEVFKLHHFAPTPLDLVITRSNPVERIVYEIDGQPATEAYARLVDRPVSGLTSEVFSRHPLMLQIGKEWFVRSIQTSRADGGLAFSCAIEDGLVLTLGQSTDFVGSLRAKVEALESKFSNIQATIGFDCVHRRLEMLQSGCLTEVEALTDRIAMTGFSTFGEQYQAVHVNQTLTGVCLGERRT